MADSNLLATNGKLSAVIDFGGLCVGDPACDLLIAWDLLSSERNTFHAAINVDEATWNRGRGWALLTGLIALQKYRETSPVIAVAAAHKIVEVLADS